MSNLDSLRAQFWDLTAKEEEILETVEPVMKELAELRARECQLKDKMAPLKLERQRIEAGDGESLADIRMAKAVLAKGLGRKVGERPAGL